MSDVVGVEPMLEEVNLVFGQIIFGKRRQNEHFVLCDRLMIEERAAVNGHIRNIA